MDGEDNVAETAIRLGFVKLIVRDLAAMAAFYERALGLRVLKTITNDSMTEKVLGWPGADGGARLVLYQHADEREVTVGNAHGPIGLFVPDVDAIYSRALAEGATVHLAPFDVAVGRVAFVHDPEGHEIEFVGERR